MITVLLITVFVAVVGNTDNRPVECVEFSKTRSEVSVYTSGNTVEFSGPYASCDRLAKIGPEETSTIFGLLTSTSEHKVVWNIGTVREGK